MGLFGKKKNQKQAQQEQQKVQRETKVYIQGAGGTIVTKSILDGTSRLKWMFRQESEHGNGWVAFGDTDSQEYVDDAKNMAIVDFNTLANIEPAVVNIFYMPVGSDLEFRTDKTGEYFVDTRTGKEIREQVKHPAQLAFEKNLKFLNQKTYPEAFFRSLFTETSKIKVVRAGEADFPTGEVVLADPIAYLGSRYETILDKQIPAGSYPVELSVCISPAAGLRIAAARLFQESYEANPKFQNQGGNFLEWKLPESGFRAVMFSSGMGDGIYSGYWGLDEEGEIVCLVVIFMNPEYF